MRGYAESTLERRILTNGADWMPGRQQSKGTRINHPEPLHPHNLTAWIYYRHFIILLAHSTCGARVVESLEAALDQSQQFIIAGSAVQARVILRADEHGRHGLGSEELAHAPVCGNSYGPVNRVCEPARIDDRGVGSV